MKPSVKPEVKQCLARALDALDSARYNLSGGFLMATANRAYYACFYCMTALLYTKDIEARTHQGTQAKFSEHFVKAGIFATSMSAIVKTLFEKRQEADYDLDSHVTEDDAKDLVAKASEFYDQTSEYLIAWLDEAK